MRRTSAIPSRAEEGPRHPADPPTVTSGQLFLAACVGAACIFAVVLTALVLEGGSSDTLVRFVTPALALLVVFVCGRTAHRAQAYNKRIWALFTAAGLCWSAGQALLLLPLSAGHPGRAAAAGLCFVVGLVPVVMALCSIPPEHSERPQRIRFWLGATIVVASVVLFCRTVVINEGPPTVLDPSLSTTVQMADCIAYVSLSILVWIVLLRAGTRGRAPLFFVSTGLVPYAWANVFFVYRSGLHPGLAVDILDASSAWCYLMFVLAALSPHAADPRQPPTQAAKGRYIGLHSLVVYVPVVAASIVVAATPRTDDPWVVVSAMLVLVLFGVRQMLLSIDNSRLREDLEARVDDLVQRSSELRRLGQQNQRIVQSVVDGVIGVDAEGVITFANPAAAAMLLRPRDQLLGMPDDQIFHGRVPTAADRPRDSIVRSAMRTGNASASATEHFVAGDGRIFPVELAVGPIVEEQEITGAVVVFRDVSERRKIEKMKNEFVSVVSHELRTPLTSIRGSLGLLAGGAAGLLSPKADRMVQVALESSDRLTRLINDMLDIERIESGTMPVELSDSEPRALIETAVNSIRGLVGNHRIVVNADPDLVLVRADPDRIVQTLTNLIGNAIKFSPPLTTITVSATNRDNFVDFSVADQGRGIPADKLGRIFERFEQVDSSDSREKGGSGLGLAISRTIVRRHGGDLTVTSTVGAGSTFRFNIPAAGESGAIATTSTTAVNSLPGGRSPYLRGDDELVGVPSVLPDVKTHRLAN